MMSLMTVFAEVNFGDGNRFQVARFGSVSSIVNIFSPILISGGAILFLVMTLSAAFNVLTAAGSADKIAKAQKTFMFAIVGLVLVISSYLIVRLLGSILSIENELKPFGF